MRSIEPSASEALLETLRENGLTLHSTIDVNEQFHIVKCRDRDGRIVVVKHNHDGSADGRERILKEALLTRDLPERKPFRTLDYRGHGERYLVTWFSPHPVLQPSQLSDERLHEVLAAAVAAFQSIDASRIDRSISTRGPTLYLLKVTAKHLVHLCPEHVTVSEALRCAWHIVRGLSDVARIRVICHGDLLPTNLIHDAAGGWVVFTDLEGFMVGHHPLFDVLALLTIGDNAIADWAWQRALLRTYLGLDPARALLDPSKKSFRRAYRSLLTFFLLYRLNEARLATEDASYFDGLTKGEFLRKRVGLLLRGRLRHRPRGSLADGLERRRSDLLAMLSGKAVDAHLEWMLGDDETKRAREA